MKTDSRPSETAEAVAAIRHAATRERDASVRCDDTLAKLFLSLRYRLITGPLRPVSREAYRRIVPGVYEWVLARTRHFDRAFSEALVKGGVTQAVILGAGYDTRAIRFQAELRRARARAFEVDHPATQGRKRRLLGARTPPDLVFVATDFNTVPILETLKAAGFRTDQPTFFLWEGVSPYLNESAVESTLRMVASVARGSAIAFDFNTRSIVEGRSDAFGSAETRRFVASRGEPLTWGIEPSELAPFLQRQGLTLRLHLGPAEMERQYLLQSDGTLVGQVTGFNHLAEAVVG
jgi:methyltransferase (TIGR00027 family)